MPPKSAGDAQMSPELAKQVRLTNRVGTFQAAVTLAFALAMPWLVPRASLYLNLPVMLAFILLYLGPVWLNRRGAHLAARVLLLSVLSFAIGGVVIGTDPALHLELMLLAFTPLPLLLFGQAERRHILFWALMPLLIFVASISIRDTFVTEPPLGRVHAATRWPMAVATFLGLLWQIASLQQANARREAELAGARDLALQASQQKSEFLANMSHEIRTPLTAILGFADLLGESCQGPQREYVDTIRRNGTHLLSVLSDILDLSKIEAGQLLVERSPCAVAQLVGEVVSLMQVKAQEKGLAFRAAFRGPVPETIQSDPIRLRQILLNLVGNAIKFTGAGGIDLAVFCERRASPVRLCFAVSDTGIGISEANQGHLFQPFSQADTSMSRRYGGTGLGLAISQRLAARLDGEIAVRSEEGKGSCFTLRIDPGPLDGVVFREELSPGLAAEPRVRPKQLLLSGVTVLLAEDGLDNQLLISTILRKAGALVVLADNGRIALEKAVAAAAADHPFAVVLMDMQMPEMDGYEATATLRRGGYTRPIVALTAHAMAGDRERCLAVGCDDYLTKPVGRQSLLETTRRAAAAPALH